MTSASWKWGRPWRLVVMHAVYLLALAPKSRVADWPSMVMFSEQERREVPEYALDKHTVRGRRMGRGTEHFFDEARGLSPCRRSPMRSAGASGRGRR